MNNTWFRLLFINRLSPEAGSAKQYVWLVWLLATDYSSVSQCRRFLALYLSYKIYLTVILASHRAPRSKAFRQIIFSIFTPRVLFANLHLAWRFWSPWTDLPRAANCHVAASVLSAGFTPQIPRFRWRTLPKHQVVPHWRRYNDCDSVTERKFKEILVITRSLNMLTHSGPKPIAYDSCFCSHEVDRWSLISCPKTY